MPSYSLRGFRRYLKQLEKRAASAVVMCEYGDQLLIVKATYKPHWSLPGGIIDQHETPRQAAVREVAEEVGIVLDPAALEFVLVVDRISATAQTYQFVFRTEVTRQMIDGMKLQASEISEALLVNRDDIARGERYYGKVIYHWANGLRGYVEQTFDVSGRVNNLNN